MGGPLEREIRLLPQVLACQLSDAECVVLVHPSGDPGEVERAVRTILGRYGKTGLSLRVFGAERPAAVVARPPIGALALLGTLAGGAALTAAVVFGNGSAPHVERRPPIAAPPVIIGPAQPRPPTHVAEPPVAEPPQEPAVPTRRPAADVTPLPPRPRPVAGDKPVVPGPKPPEPIPPEPIPPPPVVDDDDDAEDDLGQADDEDDRDELDDDRDGDDEDEDDGDDRGNDDDD